MSFKEAAAELGVTPTAISHQVRLLEEICGQRLFQRRPRPLTMTPAGEKLFPALRTGFDAFASAAASISAPSEEKPLRVTAPNAFASRWLIPRLGEWRAARPDLPLEVIGADAVLDLRGGECDIAIRYARRMPMEFAAEELARDCFGPVCRPELLDGRRIERAADLLGYPLIHFDWLGWDPDAPTWRLWLAAAGREEAGFAAVEARGRACDLSFREELHAVDAVVAGQGIGILSDVVVSRLLERGRLVKAHPFTLPGYGFYILHMPQHPRERAIRDFSAWAKASL